MFLDFMTTVPFSNAVGMSHSEIVRTMRFWFTILTIEDQGI